MRATVDARVGCTQIVGVSTEHAPDGALPLRLGVLRRLKWWVWFTEVAQPSDLQITLA